MIQDQSSTATHLCDDERESIALILESFRAQNGSPYLSFEKNRLYSQIVTKLQQLDFRINQLISLNLKEISRFQNKSTIQYVTIKTTTTNLLIC